MESKVAIWKDNRAESIFLKDLGETLERSNELIKIYEYFQTWEKIDSYKKFLDLAESPVNYFDKCLSEKCNISAMGARPDLNRVAELYGIDREAFIKTIKGVRADLRNFDKKLDINFGKPAITLDVFLQYSDFLIFTGKGFRKDEGKVAEKLKMFVRFAETPAELEAYSYWKNLVDTFNTHAKRGLVGGKAFDNACYAFGLRCVNNTAFLDEEKTYFDVLKSANTVKK